jgi:hypothetical protein
VLYSSRRPLRSKIAAFVAYLNEVSPKGSPEEVATMRDPPTLFIDEVIEIVEFCCCALW